MNHRERVELIYRDEVFAVAGAAMEVHRELGSGFLEAVYHEALVLELEARRIPFETQKPLAIRYKDALLAKGYICDLVCYDKIIVELKTVERLMRQHDAQVLNYLKATGFRVGLLFNFHAPQRLEWKRLVR